MPGLTRWPVSFDCKVFHGTDPGETLDAGSDDAGCVVDEPVPPFDPDEHAANAVAAAPIPNQRSRVRRSMESSITVSCAAPSCTARVWRNRVAG